MARNLGIDDVVDHFTLIGDELELLRNKSGATRLGFAVLLKHVIWRRRFPTASHEPADDAVALLPLYSLVQRIAHRLAGADAARPQPGAPPPPRIMLVNHLRVPVIAWCLLFLLLLSLDPAAQRRLPRRQRAGRGRRSLGRADRGALRALRTPLRDPSRSLDRRLRRSLKRRTASMTEPHCSQGHAEADHRLSALGGDPAELLQCCGDLVDRLAVGRDVAAGGDVGRIVVGDLGAISGLIDEDLLR